MSSEKPESSSQNPGVILGPDGKPCKPCTAFRNWQPRTTAKDSGKKLPTVAAVAALASSVPAHCPPDVELLGQSTWNFLHSTAAHYPEQPTPIQRDSMLALLRALPILYPCWICAEDFGKSISAAPPDVTAGSALSKWLCERHNEVNAKLGKPSFDCSKVFERWKNGPDDGSCG